MTEIQLIFLRKHIPYTVCNAVSFMSYFNVHMNFRSFKKKDELYVETKAFRELESIVDDMHWSTLLGKPGDGKSATAAHLLLKYRGLGYEPCFLSSSQDWKSLIKEDPSAQQFVVIDDIFGSSFVDDKKANDWIATIEGMIKIVSVKKGTLKVVSTSRKYVFTDVESKLKKFSCFAKKSVVDMTDEVFRLSYDEKLKIFNKFAQTSHVELNDELINDIGESDPPHGFPHCAEMFCSNAFLRQNGVAFFSNPEEFVKREIDNFQDNDSFKFLVLLLVLYKKKIHPCYFEEISEQADNDEQKLFKFVGQHRILT